MTGQTRLNRQYYRHMDQPCPGPAKKTWPRAEEIEDKVMRQLFETFGNPVAVVKAIKAATPNNQKIQQAQQRLEVVEKELAKVAASIQRIVGSIAEGIISNEEAKEKLGKWRERESKLKEEHAQLTEALAHIPTPEAIKAAGRRIADEFSGYANARLAAHVRLANYNFEEMTWEQKRELCVMVFSGKVGLDNRRLGVWVSWDATGKKWRYEIEGHFIQASGPRPRWAFEVGFPPQQKALVTRKALHSQSNSSYYRFKVQSP